LPPSATLRVNSVETGLNGDTSTEFILSEVEGLSTGSWDLRDFGDFSFARADTIGHTIQNACIE